MQTIHLRLELGINLNCQMNWAFHITGPSIILAAKLAMKCKKNPPTMWRWIQLLRSFIATVLSKNLSRPEPINRITNGQVIFKLLGGPHNVSAIASFTLLHMIVYLFVHFMYVFSSVYCFVVLKGKCMWSVDLSCSTILSLKVRSHRTCCGALRCSIVRHVASFLPHTATHRTAPHWNAPHPVWTILKSIYVELRIN